MAFLPYPSIGTFIRKVSALPGSARNGTVVFDTTDSTYYAYILGGWWKVLYVPPAVSIKRGQPMGLMGVTYADDVS